MTDLGHIETLHDRERRLFLVTEAANEARVEATYQLGDELVRNVRLGLDLLDRDVLDALAHARRAYDEWIAAHDEWQEARLEPDEPDEN